LSAPVLLRMLRHVMSNEVFRHGIENFLTYKE